MNKEKFHKLEQIQAKIKKLCDDYNEEQKVNALNFANVFHHLTKQAENECSDIIKLKEEVKNG